MKKDSLISFVITLVFVIILVCFESMQKNRKCNDIFEDGVRDTAVVNRLISAKRTTYFEYQYEVDGKIFQGSGERKFGVFQDIQIGDSVIIAYKSSDPEKSVPTNVLSSSNIEVYFPKDTLIYGSPGLQKKQEPIK